VRDGKRRPGQMRTRQGSLEVPFHKGDGRNGVFRKRPGQVFARIMVPHGWTVTDWDAPEYWVDVLSSLDGPTQGMLLHAVHVGSWRAFLAVLRNGPRGPGSVELAYCLRNSVNAHLAEAAFGRERRTRQRRQALVAKWGAHHPEPLD